MNREEILEKAQKQPDEREIEVVKTSQRVQLVTMLCVTLLYDIVLLVVQFAEVAFEWDAMVLTMALNIQLMSGVLAGGFYRYTQYKRKGDLVIVIAGVAAVACGILAIVSNMLNR